MKKHYVYRITNKIENKHYYGVRSTKLEPKDDLGIKYFSSSTDRVFIKGQKENPYNYKYKIIKIFSTREEAIKLEIKLHNKFNVSVNESFYNKAKQTGVGFDSTGNLNCVDKLTGKNIYIKTHYYNKELHETQFNKVLCKDKNKDFDGFMFVDKKIFESSDNLVGSAYKTVRCKTKNGDVYIVDKELFESSDEHISIFKNTVSVFDTISQKYSRVSSEEFKNNKNLVGLTHNKVLCTNGITNFYISSEEYKTGNYISVLKGRNVTEETKNKIKQTLINKSHVEIYNDKDELMHEIHDDINQIKDFCRENCLPLALLNYKPLYLNDIPNNIKSKLINRGFFKYKGWYCVKKYH